LQFIVITQLTKTNLQQLCIVPTVHVRYAVQIAAGPGRTGDTIIYVSIPQVALLAKFRFDELYFVTLCQVTEKAIDRELRPFCTLC